MGMTDPVLGQKESSWVPLTFIFYEYFQAGVTATQRNRRVWAFRHNSFCLINPLSLPVLSSAFLTWRAFHWQRDAVGMPKVFLAFPVKDVPSVTVKAGLLLHPSPHSAASTVSPTYPGAAPHPAGPWAGRRSPAPHRPGRELPPGGSRRGAGWQQPGCPRGQRGPAGPAGAESGSREPWQAGWRLGLRGREGLGGKNRL